MYQIDFQQCEATSGGLAAQIGACAGGAAIGLLTYSSSELGREVASCTPSNPSFGEIVTTIAVGCVGGVTSPITTLSSIVTIAGGYATGYASGSSSSQCNSWMNFDNFYYEPSSSGACYNQVASSDTDSDYT